MARRRARELAFRTLFQAERGAAPLLEVWRQVRQDLAETDADSSDDGAYGDQLDTAGIAFAGTLLESLDAHHDEIDTTLGETIEGWNFVQMAQTDLNVLRLAVAELLYHPQTPAEVVIEVAVRNAKKYGGEESGRFVNGVLAKLYRRLATRDAGVSS